MPVFEAEKSKIKMSILTKPNCKNEVWWSPLNQNKKYSEIIIKGMLRRLRGNKIFKDTQVVQFYEAGQLIYQEKFV